MSLDIDGFQEMSFLFPLLFLIAAASGTYVLANRIVHAQRSQIGMLMANGFSHRTILGHYLSYGIFVGLVGALPGAVAGALLARSVTSLYLSELSIPVAASTVRPISILIGIGLGLLMGAVATLAPAWTAARLSPVKAMRGISASGTGSPSLIERIVPPLKRTSARWKLVMRGIGRSKQRSLSTVVGVILALVLILVSWSMIDTVNILLDRQFGEIEQQDVTVYFSAPVTIGQLDELRAIEGVERVEPTIELSSTIQFQGHQYPTTLIGLEPDTRLHTFRSEDGNQLELPTSGILVGQALRDQIGVDQGDQVTLQIPSLATSTEATIEGFVDEPLGTFAYSPLSQVAGLYPQNTQIDRINAALISYSPNVDREAIGNRLDSTPNVAATRDAQYLADTMRSYMSLFYAFVGVMLIFGGVMAFSLIFNTMLVNITERSVEFATLEAAGMEERSIQKIVVAENMFLVSLAIVPGLLTGYLCARWFMASFSTDLFQFDLQVYPPTFLLSALAVIAVALLSQWPRVARYLTPGSSSRHAENDRVGERYRPAASHESGAQSKG
ncbi:MAG: FtsX-like permease family protein [Thermomicrobiales bacterium]